MPKASFAVVPGTTRYLGEPVRLDRAAILAGRDSTPPVPAARAVPGSRAGLLGRARKRRFRATPLSDISRRLFGDDDRTAPPPGPCSRRSPQRRLGAGHRSRCAPTCSSGWSAACGHAPTPPASGVPDADRQGRGVGRLLAVPASTCPDCGSRVLELLYCYECGDVSLGGYVVQRPEDGGFVLGPTAPDIPALEAQPISRRRHGQYMWYWPGKQPHPADPSWTKTPAQRQAGDVQLPAGRA